MSLLIVEDNKIVQNILVEISQFLNYDFDVASNGFEALQATAENQYDVILMDCQMSGLDGFETTKKIRETQNKNKNTPIIAIPGQTSAENLEKCKFVGMNDVLTKPFEIDDLSELIAHWGNQNPQSDSINSDVKSNNKEVTRQNALPIDLNRLKKISGGAEQDSGILLADFLSNISGDLQHLEEAVAENLPAKIINYAHNCAGVSAFCGMNALAAVFYKIEAEATRNDFRLIEQLLEEIKFEIIQIKSEINS